MASKIIERTWRAPLATVWKLWATAEGFASWYGPPGFVLDMRAFEARADGPLRYTMRAVAPAMVARMEAAGQPGVRSVDGRFTEVEPMSVVGIAEPFGSQWMHTRARFEVRADQVRLTLEIEAPTEDWVRGAAMGWEGALSKLGQRLEGLHAG